MWDFLATVYVLDVAIVCAAAVDPVVADVPAAVGVLAGVVGDAICGASVAAGMTALAGVMVDGAPVASLVFLLLLAFFLLFLSPLIFCLLTLLSFCVQCAYVDTFAPSDD